MLTVDEILDGDHYKLPQAKCNEHLRFGERPEFSQLRKPYTNPKTIDSWEISAQGKRKPGFNSQRYTFV
jgi:hypothetical protein